MGTVPRHRLVSAAARSRGYGQAALAWNESARLAADRVVDKGPDADPQAPHRPSTARAIPVPLRPFITVSRWRAGRARLSASPSRSAFSVARLVVLAALSLSIAVRCAATCFRSAASLVSAAFSVAVSSSLSSIRTSTCSSMRWTSAVKVAISAAARGTADCPWPPSVGPCTETFCWAVAASFSSSRRAAWLSANAVWARSTAAAASASCASSAAIRAGARRCGGAHPRPGFPRLAGRRGW